MTSTRRYSFLPPPLIACVFLLSFVGYFFVANPIFSNPDLPWHIAAGDWIISHGQIPKTDPWSYTADNRPWLNVSWLWDIITSLVFRHTGASGLYLLGCTLGAANIALLAWVLQKRRIILDDYILLTSLLVWTTQLMVLYPTSQLITICLACLFHHIASRQRRDGIIDKRCVTLLPLLMLFWVNTHAGFITGFTILGAYCIEAYESKNFGWLKAQLCLAALCGVACLINPYGYHSIEGVLRSLNSVITSYLADWHPVAFGTDWQICVPLIFFILCSNVRDPNIRLADKVLAFAWLLAGLQARRNFIIFSVLAAPYFSYCFQEFARATQRQHFKPVQQFFADNSKQFTACALALVGWGVMSLSPVRCWLLDKSKLDIDPYQIKAAVDLISSRYPDVRFINDYNIGGHLIFESDGKWKVFSDGRAGTAYPESLLKDVTIVALPDKDASDIFKKYGATGFISMRTNPYYLIRIATDKSWQEIYSNDSIVACIHKTH